MHRRATPWFLVALVLYTVGSELAMLLASTDRKNDRGTVTTAAVVGLLVAAVLWFFAGRGHGWPKWCLLILVVLGVGSELAFLDARSLLALVDVAALVALLRGWSETQRADAGTID